LVQVTKGTDKFSVEIWKNPETQTSSLVVKHRSTGELVVMELPIPIFEED